MGVNKTNHSKDSFNTTGATIHRSKKFVKTYPRQILLCHERCVSVADVKWPFCLKDDEKKKHVTIFKNEGRVLSNMTPSQRIYLFLEKEKVRKYQTVINQYASDRLYATKAKSTI